VSYYIFLLTGFISLAAYSWSLRPLEHKRIDTSLSTVLCDNGTAYSYIDIMEEERTYIPSYGRISSESAKKACKYGLPEEYSTVINPVEESRKTLPREPNFTLNEVETTSVSGSWLEVILSFLIGGMLVFIVTGLIRETLYYILFEKKLTLRSILSLY